MSLRCFCGIHDWGAKKLLPIHDGYLLSCQECRRCRRRRVGWLTAGGSLNCRSDHRGPPRPRPRPLPRDTIVKGGMGEKPAGAPAKDPNAARSGAEFREPPLVGEVDCSNEREDGFCLLHVRKGESVSIDRGNLRILGLRHGDKVAIHRMPREENPPPPTNPPRTPPPAPPSPLRFFGGILREDARTLLGCPVPCPKRITCARCRALKREREQAGCSTDPPSITLPECDLRELVEAAGLVLPDAFDAGPGRPMYEMNIASYRLRCREALDKVCKYLEPFPSVAETKDDSADEHRNPPAEENLGPVTVQDGSACVPCCEADFQRDIRADDLERVWEICPLLKVEVGAQALLAGSMAAYGFARTTRAEQWASINAWCKQHGGRVPTLAESLGIPDDWHPSEIGKIVGRVAAARRKRGARRSR